jgi:hypothetical protein
VTDKDRIRLAYRTLIRGFYGADEWGSTDRIQAKLDTLRIILAPNYDPRSEHCRVNLETGEVRIVRKPRKR